MTKNVLAAFGAGFLLLIVGLAFGSAGKTLYYGETKNIAACLSEGK